MNSPETQAPNTTIRPIAYRDLQTLEQFRGETPSPSEPLILETQNHHTYTHRLSQIRQWYWLVRLLKVFPNPYQHLFSGYVAEQEGQLRGIIRISPFNRTRSTWHVDKIWVQSTLSKTNIGTLLLRYCMEAISEARTWLLEVNVNDQDTLALYRCNGFQPLAQHTYWELNPELQQQLAERETDLPNLMPVSNADAQLLCQLDTAAMPPVIRQVFDRHIHDFQTNLLGNLFESIKQWATQTETVSAYVFEPQRKAAIGYFQLTLSRKGTEPHHAQLTVHPAYTWLYPELLSQMARIVIELPPQSLQLASADYQPEREEYLEQIGATRISHTLLMSRSVWHKLRESRLSPLEALQLTEVLQGLGVHKPAPTPSRIPWIGKPSISVNKTSLTTPSPETDKNQAPDSLENNLQPPNNG